jgi:hypothetical protein
LKGTRELKEIDFRPKILSQSDVILLRNLMAENYRVWGYEDYCETPTFEESIKKFNKEKVCFQFEVQEKIAKSHDDHHLMVEEDSKIQESCEKERLRRTGNFRIIPLLYDIDELNESIGTE